MTPALIRAQAMEMRGADIGARRSEELAADLARLDNAVREARDRLDFNDEPARFAALLAAPARAAAKRK